MASAYSEVLFILYLSLQPIPVHQHRSIPFILHFSSQPSLFCEHHEMANQGFLQRLNDADHVVCYKRQH